MPTKNTKQPTNKDTDVYNRLTDAVSRVADVLESQNRYRRRFLMGIVFGVGTAIGASIIASILVLWFSWLLQVVGLDETLLGDNLTGVVEEQVQ